jgi:hypothetical protein
MVARRRDACAMVPAARALSKSLTKLMPIVLTRPALACSTRLPRRRTSLYMELMFVMPLRKLHHLNKDSTCNQIGPSTNGGSSTKSESKSLMKLMPIVLTRPALAYSTQLPRQRTSLYMELMFVTPSRKPCHLNNKQGFYVQPDRAFNKWWVHHKKRTPIPDGHVIPILPAMQGHPESPCLWEKHAARILCKLGLTPTVQ